MNEDPTADWIQQIATPYPNEIREMFVAKSGSQEIASAFALWQIWTLYCDRRPETVCEVGAGIGTITYLLAQWRIGGAAYLAVEDNAWCIEQAKLNLGRWAGTVLWYDRVPDYGAFDMVIVDGPQIDLSRTAVLNERATVIFEGNRRDQRQRLESALKEESRPFGRVNLKPEDRSKGIWVYQLEPTAEEQWRFYGIAVKEFLKDLKARLAGRPVGKRRRA